MGFKNRVAFPRLHIPWDVIIDDSSWAMIFPSFQIPVSISNKDQKVEPMQVQKRLKGFEKFCSSRE